MECTPRERAICAIYQLTEEADHWWEAEQNAMAPETLGALTWTQFKDKFFEKYVPRTYRNKKETEFWNLKQGARTVTEYDRVFNQLSRYALHLVDTDEKRSDRFRQGLKPEIGLPLASHGRLTYPEVLSRALSMEAVLPKEEKKTTPQVFDQKRKWDERNPGQHNYNQNNNKGKRHGQGAAPIRLQSGWGRNEPKHTPMRGIPRICRNGTTYSRRA